MGGQVAGASRWPSAWLPLADACRGRAGQGWGCPRSQKGKPDISDTSPINAVIRGVRGRKQQGNTGQKGRKISVFIYPSVWGLLLLLLLIFFFPPPRIQSAGSLVLSGALNSSWARKAGLVRGRERWFARADTCKVTHSLAINYSVSHRKQQQERGSTAAAGAGGRGGRYITP